MPTVEPYVNKGARLSSDGRYRYLLWREWRGTHNPKNWYWYDKEKVHGEPLACMFIMLNPSTADDRLDDPTIRRCIGFAKAWKFEKLVVANLFAYRTPKPKVLFGLTHQDDPVGVENQQHIVKAACDAGRIICAWGTNGDYLDQDQTVLGWLPSDIPRFSLGRTDKGFPRHPLYVPGNQQPEPFL